MDHRITYLDRGSRWLRELGGLGGVGITGASLVSVAFLFSAAFAVILTLLGSRIPQARDETTKTKKEKRKRRKKKEKRKEKRTFPWFSISFDLFLFFLSLFLFRKPPKKSNTQATNKNQTCYSSPTCLFCLLVFVI